MDQQIRRILGLHRKCALTLFPAVLLPAALLPAALACGSADSLPAGSSARLEGGPSPAPNGAAPNGNGNVASGPGGNPSGAPGSGAPGSPANTGSSTGQGTAPGTSANEGIGPIELTPPTSDGSSAEGDASEGDASQPPVPTIPTVPVGDGTCPAPDGLLALLQSFAPPDEDLAEDFAGYLGAEVGPLTCATSGTGGSRTITQTIVVPPDTVYDGNGEVLTADPIAMNCDLTEGEQGESQRPYFLLAPGASLRNVTIDYPGCEGVHMMGNNILENITWVDVGEDAASVRSYFPGGTFAILNSQADHASDKTFQFNAPGAVLIRDFVGADMGKLVRQNGGTEFEFHVDLNNVTVSEVISAVVQSDSPICFVRHHDLSFAFTGSGDKSERVFRDIPAANVTEY